MKLTSGKKKKTIASFNFLETWKDLSLNSLKTEGLVEYLKSVILFTGQFNNHND